MTQTQLLSDDKTGIACLPGTARFLAISAAYLAVVPTADSSSDLSGYIDGADCPVPRTGTEPTGARL